MSAEVETTQDAEAQGPAHRWLREIELSSRHEHEWRERAKKIVKRYRDDDRKTDEDTKQQHRFAILYANTQILRGVMYQKTPVPDVRRRFLDKDPVGRQVAQILQRALSYSVDSYDFDGTMEAVVDDVLLPGRGVACVRYIPTMGAEITGPDGKPFQPVAYQEVRCDYVEWEMLRISPAKRWRKVRWVALGELMTREDLVSAFGADKGNRCTLDWSPPDKEFENDEMFKRALVWAVWDKKTKKVYFVSKGLPRELLAEVADPLGLEQFFPIPKPVYSIPTTDSLIPVPEYFQYQDQAIELDDITDRIDVLVGELRVRGVADTSIAELSKMAKAVDGEIIPIEDAARMAAIMERGGLEKAVLFWPIEIIAGVLVGLYEQREQVKATIYEITGLSDIVRGSSKASETATAQEIKGRYANVRVGPRQKLIAHFARDIFRMKAEIISEKFTPETLKLMTGPELWQIEAEQVDPVTGQKQRVKVDATPQIMGLLRNDKLRGFRVDIETDSTVLPDAAEEQKNRVEVLGGVAQFMQGVGPAVQTGALPKEFAIELLSFGLRGFKLGPQLEEAIDRLRDQDQASAQQQLTQMQQQLMQAQEREQGVAKKAQELATQEQALKDQKAKDDYDLLKRKSDLDMRELKMNAEERVNKVVAESKEKDTQNAEKVIESGSQVSQRIETALRRVEETTQKHDEQIGALVDALRLIAEQQAQLADDVRKPRKRTPQYGPNGRIAAVMDELVN